MFTVARALAFGGLVLVTLVARSATAEVVVPQGVDLFWSAFCGYNEDRYMQLYNAGNVTANLEDFGFPNTANAVSVPGAPEYWNAFAAGAVLEPGKVYTIVHPNANQTFLDQADQTNAYISDKNDGFALAYGNMSDFVIIDIVGTFMGDSLRGWDVCGVVEATDDYAMLRKENTVKGNFGAWAKSAGTTADDCDWIVYGPERRFSILGIWGNVWGKPLEVTTRTATQSPRTTTTTTAPGERSGLDGSELEGSEQSAPLTNRGTSPILSAIIGSFFVWLQVSHLH